MPSRYNFLSSKLGTFKLLQEIACRSQDFCRFFSIRHELAKRHLKVHNPPIKLAVSPSLAQSSGGWSPRKQVRHVVQGLIRRSTKPPGCSPLETGCSHFTLDVEKSGSRGLLLSNGFGPRKLPAGIHSHCIGMTGRCASQTTNANIGSSAQMFGGWHKNFFFKTFDFSGDRNFF
jgi:hypothetical protein